jgi:hypothetical protein
LGRGLSDSKAFIVVTVSSKEFLGTLRTRLACGKLVKNSLEAFLIVCVELGVEAIARGWI